MANEFSKAGEYYNKFAIKFLNDQLNSFTNIESFPVIENLKDAFIKFSEEAFENPIIESEINISTDLIIQLKPGKKIVFKKCFIDEMGFSNFFGSGFEPNYCITKDNDKINIIFEASGKVTKISPDCHISKDGNLVFSISGKKEIKLFPEEESKYKIYENNIKQGNFNLNIKLPYNNEFKLENPDEPEFIKGSTENGNGGIYTFSYNLNKKNKKKKIYE
jgi:HSP20 family molecular chaperone IbpA